MTAARTALVDAEARRRIAEDLDATFLVEAAAGTGKTTALVSRLVALLASGRARAATLVATTFTEKAAGELVVRTREALDAALAAETRGSPRHAHLLRAIAELETARIGTIHGLATDLLRELPIEAGLDPSFRVMGEEESAELLDRTVTRWLEERLAAPTPGFARWLVRPPTWPDTLRSTLLEACTSLADRRDLDARWSAPSFDLATQIDEVLAALEALRAPLEEARGAGVASEDELLVSLEELVGVLDEEALAARVSGGRDLARLEAALVRAGRGKQKKGRGRRFGARARDEVLALRDRAIAALASFRRDADGSLAAALQPELEDAVRRYEDEKRRLGLVDYTDLLLVLRRVLGTQAEVRAALQARFTHVLVDEVQDTDPVQYEIVRLLVASDPAVSDPRASRPVPGKLFVVGDPKQAIYRFRRADLDAYHENRRALVEAGAEILHLRTSFRAEPSIQAAVNRALGGGVPEHALPEYVALAPHRAARTDRPSVIVLPVPRPYGRWGTEPWGPTARASCAEAVGALVHDLVTRRGWTVEEDGREVALEPRHVAILFKRTVQFGDDLLVPYVQALERRGIPLRSAERRAFFEREEIAALRAVLAAIEWMDDSVAVYAALRGPFLALTDAELLAYLREHGSLHPLRVPRKLELAAGVKPPAGEEVADALRLLRSLHVARHQRPIAETIQRFLDATRAHALLALAPSGERALANVGQLLALARRAEARGVLSFRRFVEELEARAEDAKTGEVTTEDEGAHGVTLSTVHAAKGLEFPVVILADPTAPRSYEHPRSYTDRARGLHVLRIGHVAPLELSQNAAAVTAADEEEARRLLYVAATRARDLLVVPSCGDVPFRGWTEPLERALRPHRDARPASAPGCPPLGDDTVLERPAHVAQSLPDAVTPGLYAFDDGGSCVWWGPSALSLEASAAPGVRDLDLLEPPERSGNDGGVARARELALARARRIEDATPTSDTTREPLSVFADMPLAITAIEVDVEEATVAASLGAPRDDHATRKLETLLRGALAVTARDVSAESAVEYVGRALATAPTDLALATAAVAALTGSPALRGLLDGASAVRTQAWVALATPSGALAEGRVPLVVERSGEIWALSVAVSGELTPSRARELGLAATAISRDTGQRVRARLFVIG